jgi:hypothetical protein
MGFTLAIHRNLLFRAVRACLSQEGVSSQKSGELWQNRSQRGLWQPSAGGWPTAVGSHSLSERGRRLGTDLELKSSGPNENTPHR